MLRYLLLKSEEQKLWERLNIFWNLEQYEQAKLIADLMMYLEKQ